MASHGSSPADLADLADLPPRVRAALAASPTPDVPFRARRLHVHSTWARTFTSLPELYLQPESVAEVRHAVALARACRRRLVTVGSAHSPSDLTCTSGWLLNLDRLDRVLAVDDARRQVTVQAGIRLYRLGEALDARGLALPNLGSIDSQSIAGAIATGTHGSSLRHGLLSAQVRALTLVLGDGRLRTCSPTDDPDLFRAATLSLGALGVVVEITLQVVPAFSLRWDQTIHADETVFAAWEDRQNNDDDGKAGRLWSQADFVRVWWFPYMRRAVVWKADVVDPADLAAGRVRHRDPPRSYYDGALGYYVYHNLLLLGRYVPRLLPWVEWFVFGMQYGFRNGPATTVAAVQPSRRALLMNCLYSQYVDEWALPLRRGPEALRRLGAWLQRLRPGDPGYVAHGIPFSADGLYVHSPVEVRVSDTARGPAVDPRGAPRLASDADRKLSPRPWLDPSVRDDHHDDDNGPTLYLNAIMYRPYGLDPPGTDRYYAGFEWLMRELGGRPHWAKNFGADVRAADVERWYGDDLRAWRRVRDEADPDGVFVGPWHRRVVLGGGGETSEKEAVAVPLPNEEVEAGRAGARGGGVLWRGRPGGE